MSIEIVGQKENYVNNRSENSHTISKSSLNKVNNMEYTDESGKLNIVTEKKIKDAITMANNKLLPTKTRCEYTYHDDINQISIKIYDCDTDKVVKEIPTEDAIKAIQKIWELAGLLVDEKR